MFSLLFAATEGNLDMECLKYKGSAIGGIRDKIACIKGAVSESTIGAILLLAGVEVGRRLCRTWLAGLLTHLTQGSVGNDLSGPTSHVSCKTATRHFS